MFVSYILLSLPIKLLTHYHFQGTNTSLAIAQASCLRAQVSLVTLGFAYCLQWNCSNPSKGNEVRVNLNLWGWK